VSTPGPDGVRVAFEGPLFRVEVQTWGDRRRDVVRHPGACGAVVLIEGDRVLLVRQLREAVGRALLEIPAGIYDVEGEAPADAIRREIAEETGHLVTELKRLGSIFTTPGFTDERIDLFLCRARPDGDPQEHEIDVIAMAFGEAIRMALDGTIQDAKSVVALLLTRERLAAETDRADGSPH
jgi:ADP-ribose pyrophosphatase